MRSDDTIAPFRHRDALRRREGRDYLDWLRRTLEDETRFRKTSQAIRQAAKSYAHRNRSEMVATWRGATWVLLRTLAAVALPLLLTALLAARGWGALGLLLAPLSGAALFGVISIVHDTVHGSFTPSRRANRLIGKILAPVVLLDFESFRASHLGHHRHSQSVTRDPKAPKLSAAQDEPIASPVMRIWYRAAASVSSLPSRPRHVFYLVSLLLLGLPVVTLFAGELSFRQRNWRRSGPWTSLAVSGALIGTLTAVSPFVGLCFSASLWVAMALFFGVFLTHMSPYQLFMSEENPSVPFFSLNISDIVVHPFVELLGNAFTEYHAAHHLFPYVPSYRLRPVGLWLDKRFAGRKAPRFEMLSPSQFNVLADSLVSSLLAERCTFIPWQTPAGELLQRPRVAHDEASEVPRSSQRWLPTAA